MRSLPEIIAANARKNWTPEEQATHDALAATGATVVVRYDHVRDRYLFSAKQTA